MAAPAYDKLCKIHQNQYLLTFLPERKDQTTERNEKQQSPEEDDGLVGGQSSIEVSGSEAGLDSLLPLASWDAFAAWEPSLITGERRKQKETGVVRHDHVGIRLCRPSLSCSRDGLSDPVEAFAFAAGSLMCTVRQ